jgi:hypothetical protein
MKDFAELVQRLLEIQSGERKRPHDGLSQNQSRELWGGTETGVHH